MGTWGMGPFENDGAHDFLDDGSDHPEQAVRDALAVLKRRDYLDVDEAQAALAACELVALGFGYGRTAGLDKRILRFAAALGPNDALRKLALDALPRIAQRKVSELADLWHEGSDGSKFDAAVANLKSRLEAASDD